MEPDGTERPELSPKSGKPCQRAAFIIEAVLIGGLILLGIAQVVVGWL